MLHKKKRWTAAMHASGQAPAPVLLPAASSAAKSLWSGQFPSNTSPRSLPISPASSSNSVLKQTPSTCNYMGSNFTSTPTLSHSSLTRSVPTESYQNSTRLVPPPTSPSLVNETVPAVHILPNRSDTSANAPTTMSHCSDLLQQPGLLLQILPQEYIENYAKSLEKQAVSDKVIFNNTNPTSKLVEPCNKPNELVCSQSTSPGLFRGPQTTHRSETVEQQLAFPSGASTGFNCQNSLYRPTITEPNLDIRSTPGPRHVNNPIIPATSCSSVTSAGSQRFSPHRRAGVPMDVHTAKSWSPGIQLPSTQQAQLSGLDYSTISAVARAASLLHSSSRINAAAALFSQWDSGNLLSPNRDCIPKVEGIRPKQVSTGLSLPMTSSMPHIGFHLADYGGSNASACQPAGTQLDIAKHRTSDEGLNSCNRLQNSAITYSMLDPRRQSTKPLGLTGRQPEGRPLQPSPIPTITDTAKSFHVSLPWPPVELRSDKNSHTNISAQDRVTDSADSRLSILHDAKIAALSVDWPSSVSSSSAGSSKPPRARSSSSFSSPFSSNFSDLISPLLQSSLPSQQQSLNSQYTHGRCPSSVKDLSLVPSSPSSIGSTSPSPTARTKSTVHSSSPTVVTVPIKSPKGSSQPCFSSPIGHHNVSPHNSSNTVTTNSVGKCPFSIPTSTRHADDQTLKPSIQSISSSGIANKVTSSALTTKPSQHSDNMISWSKPSGIVPSLPVTHTILVPSINITASQSDGAHTTTSANARSSMPLKKRLIQRYEADSGSNTFTSHKNPEIADAVVQKLSPRSPIQPDSQHFIAADPFHHGISSSSIHPYRQDVQHIERTGAMDKTLKVSKSESSEECKNQVKRHNDHFFSYLPENALPQKSATMRGSAATCNKRAACLGASRKLGNGVSRSPEVYGRQSKIRNTSDELFNPNRTRRYVGRRARRLLASEVRPSISADETEMDTSQQQRSSPINGTCFMASPGQARPTDSSESRGSSSSFRSMKADDESDTDSNFQSTELSHVSKFPTLLPRNKSTRHDHTSNADYDLDASSQSKSPNSTQPINDRVRKTKRAAALAASAAALAVSANLNVKRARLASTNPGPTKRRPAESVGDDFFREDEDSVSTDDESCTMTAGSKSPSSLTKNTMLDELSIALIEDKITMEELIAQLPESPDLHQLTERSLHPSRSLDHYKRTRTSFVQLVSCNDNGLKQIPKCRACRQLKRSHFDSSSMNGNELGGSDEDKTETKTHSPDGSDPGHFKRPTGRNSQHDRDSNRMGPNDTEKPKSGDRTRRKNVSTSPVSVFCRFWGFRKLAFNNRGVLKIAGFCHSNEAIPVDRSLWEMHRSVLPRLDCNRAKYIVERAGTLFCRLLRQELAVLIKNRDRLAAVLDRGPGAPSKNGLKRGGTIGSRSPHPADNLVAWKRPVKGVREMCDVCETTMFNTHWVCAKCGYSVCVDCHAEANASKRNSKLESENGGNTVDSNPNRDKIKGKQSRSRGGPPGWASCTTTRQHHDPERLLLTSLLPAFTVGRLLHRVHRIARHYQIRLGCGCLPNGASQVGGCDAAKSTTSDDSTTPTLTNETSLGLLADLAIKSGNQHSVGFDSNCFKLDPDTSITDRTSKLPAHTWIRKPEQPSSLSNMTPKDIDEGRCRINAKYTVLQLHDPQAAHVIDVFQHEWRANRPVVISGCQHRFDASLWSPRSFAEEFGPLRTTLVDCSTGIELTRYPLRTFWDGFERKTRRLVSKDGRALCLKLKDWPTTDDFAELQPHRFSDLMNNLPLPDYTSREGQMNLASRLTSFFVCPDLGPKLYVAYGTGGSRSIGTTNLHVDIADAINILLYVGHPSDSAEESSANAEAVLNVMRQANVDPVYIERAVRWMRQMQLTNSSSQRAEEQSNDVDVGPPGALWHIFLPEDVAALREFLTQITEEETGAPLEPGSDPIHDQLFYLDQPLLDRLYSFTGVLPCTLIQFTGDAVFIPAGAAHQVRNLNSCIKAAVDFVSPEHLPQCFQLIEEFRRLSSTHQNHEDKLQVKNMLFHAVKDALSVLLLASETKSESNPVRERSPLMHHLGHVFDPDSISTKPDFLKIEERVHTRSNLDRCSVATFDSDSSEYSTQICRSQDLPSSKVVSNGCRVKGRPGRPRSNMVPIVKAEVPSGSDPSTSHSNSPADSKAGTSCAD